jgi:hypothetical protein
MDQLWTALGTRASKELGFFSRTVERLSPERAFPILCLDTDRAPDALCDAHGRPDSARFVSLSGFAPRRWAEEELEANPASLAWLSPDAFDLLPREYVHESAAKTRVLGRLAYERCRAAIRAKLAASMRTRVGIALDAGGGMSGALLPLLADLREAAGGKKIVVDVVLAIGRPSAQAFATLREVERAAALDSVLDRAHLIRSLDDEVLYTGLLELIQSTDSLEAPRTASGEADRESARGRLFESTRHARELEASGRAPKVFFVHGLRELCFPMEMLERTLIARYERELVAEALAGEPRKTGRAGQMLPQTLLAAAERAGFRAIELELEGLAKKKLDEVLAPMLASPPDAREVKAGKAEEKLRAFHEGISSVARELEESARAPIDASLGAVRGALAITPHIAESISVPAIAEGARSAVELARNTARSLESGRKEAINAEALERRFEKLVARTKPLHEAAGSFLGAEKKILAAWEPIAREALELAKLRFQGAIDGAKAAFYRKVSISDVRSIDASPLEAFARAVARLRDCHVAAMSTQLEYTAMRRAPPAPAGERTARLFLPDARGLSEIERLTEMKELFSPMSPTEGTNARTPSFEELVAVLETLAAEEGLTLEVEAETADPARFVTLLKRAIRARAMRFFSPKIVPRLSLYLGRLRAEARLERAELLRFSVPFTVRADVLDLALDRPEPLAIGGALIADSPPIEVRELHGWSSVAWDRVVVDRASCAVPLFAIAEAEAMRPLYEAAIGAEVLHPDGRLLASARSGTWSLDQSRLPTSKALAEGAKSMIGTVEEVPVVVAAAEPVEPVEPAEPPPAALAPPVISSTPAPVLPHPDAIATFARARALTRALEDADLAAQLLPHLPVRTQRFSARVRFALIEMERLPGEGWHVFAVGAREHASGEFELLDRVALGRYDLAANLLAYAAVPEIVRAHARFIEVVEGRVDRASFDEMRRRLASRVEEQRDARRNMKTVERELYDRLLTSLL